MDVFKSTYKVRRFGKQVFSKGYSHSSYEDFEMKINIQPAGDTTELSESGQRVYSKLVGFSNSPLQSANQYSQIRADRIYYDGSWYDCTSCVKWSHGMLIDHYNSEFSRVPESEEAMR